MRLPSMTMNPTKTRQQIVKFGGLNMGEDGTVGEFAATLNVCSDLYPCLAPRTSRTKINQLEVPNGIYSGDDLYYVDGTTLYRNGEILGSVTNGKKKIIRINTKIVVFPDNVYFNTDDKDNYMLTSVEPSDWETDYASYFVKNGDEFEAVSADAAPYWMGNRYYKYRSVHSLGAEIELGGGTFEFSGNSITFNEDSVYALYPAETLLVKTENYYAYGDDAVSFSPTSGAVEFQYTEKVKITAAAPGAVGDIVEVLEHKTTGALKIGQYDGSNNTNYDTIAGFGVVTQLVDIHEDSGASGDSDKLTYEVQVYRVCEHEKYRFIQGFSDMFKAGDAVVISGCGRYPANNLTLVVRAVFGNTLLFDDDVFVAGLETGTVRISREIPVLDVVCEYNNRLWGAGDNAIYASALGDPTNWNVFDGLSSDSFTVGCASNGSFTGCIGYSGSVIFFKEDVMYKVMGDYPANYVMYSYNVPGVCHGSHESLVNINEQLFYHSLDGVYVYTGSVPQLISYKFGEERFCEAVAAVFDRKYYISMCNTLTGQYELFTYDTLRDIWLREDSLHVTGFAEYENSFLMLCADGALMEAKRGDDEIVEWSAELCEITEYINNRKCYSKLSVQLELYAGSEIRVELRCDRGEWETVWQRRVGNGEGEFRNPYTATIPVRPTRCDRFSIRLSGKGVAVIRSLMRTYELGSEV